MYPLDIYPLQTIAYNFKHAIVRYTDIDFSVNVAYDQGNENTMLNAGGKPTKYEVFRSPPREYKMYYISVFYRLLLTGS